MALATGLILYHLDQQQFAEYFEAVEISKSAVEQLQERQASGQIPNLKEVQVFDGYRLPYEDQSFDLVILSHVLEHVEHVRLLLRELHRVAKQLFIEIPLDYRSGVDRRIDHFLAYGHIMVYTPSLARYLLKSEHFDVLD